MAKIKSLTKAQKARFDFYIEKWTKIGLSTDPIDRKKHDAAVAAVYGLAKMGAPEMIYFDSPLQGAMEAAKYQAAQKNSNTLEWVYWLWGNQWAGYAAWADFFKTECGVDVNQDCLDMMEYGHYIWPFERVCFASERPLAIRTDDRGLSHSEVSPAVEYRDGWGPYCWHGVVVPDEWIKNPDYFQGSAGVSKALTWSNIEQRRAACEIIGWARVLRELNAETIDKDKDPEIGELVAVHLPEAGRQQFLKVRCATGRDFAILVPNSVKTAHEANAATWGRSANQYNPEVQT